ncbi:MAG: hypothetical protein AAF558_02870 [Verrucomicrobiota bacterium]
MNLFLVLAVVVLVSSCGKSKVDQIEQEIRSAGGKLTFEELNVTPSQPLSEEYLEFKKAVKTLKEAHKKTNLPSLSSYVETDYHAKYYRISEVEPFDENEKVIAWEEVHRRYQPVLEAYKECQSIWRGNDIQVFPEYEKGASCPISHASVNLDLGKISSDIVYLKVQSGDLQGAIEVVAFAKEVFSRLHHPRVYMLIEGLIGVTLNGILHAASWQIVESPGVAAHDLDHLWSVWRQDPSAINMLADSFEGERLVFLHHAWLSLEQDFQELSWIDLFGKSEVNLGSKLSLLKDKLLLKLIYYPFWIDTDKAYSMRVLWETHQEVVAMQSNPKSLSDGLAEIRAIQEDVNNKIHTFPQMKYVFSEMVLPANQGAVEKFLFFELRTNQLCLAIQLRKAHLENRRYPMDLKLMENAVDQMNGDTMVYNLDESGEYKLYSVAFNGIDDGGAWTFYKDEEGGKKVREDRSPDWLWPRPLKK